jgi:hypothetical protein
MWKSRKAAVTVLCIAVVGFGCIYNYNTAKKAKMLNELASSMALDLFAVSRDLDAGNIGAAREKLRNSIKIVDQIRVEEKLTKSYWSMFDYYVNGNAK